MVLLKLLLKDIQIVKIHTQCNFLKIIMKKIG